VLGDALVLVAAAIPLGLVLGLAAATGVIQVTRGAYNLPHLPMQVPPFSAVEAMIVGVVVTLAAALVPAQRAASVVPVAAIRTGSEERTGVGRTWMLGLLSVAAGLTVVFLFDQRRVDAGSILILLGAVVLVPAVMAPIAAAAGRVTRRLARGVGTVGVLHLRKEPRRSAYTLALVMVVLAMVFTSGAVHLSLRRNLNDTIDQRFPADLAVYAGGQFNDQLETKVLSTPGVRSGARVWFTSGAMRRPLASRVYLTAFDPREFFAIQGLTWRDGNDASVRDAMARGGAVALPDWVTLERSVRRGDSVTLATARGPQRYTVAGIYRSQALAPLLLNIADGRRDFALSAPTLLAVKVEQGRDPATIKAAIERSFAGRAPVFVALTSVQRGDFTRGQTQFFNLVYALVLIALVMGMLGVTNTLAMAVLRRTREIGILRAVGTERAQLRRMALVEASTIAFAGMVLALPLGLLLSFTVLQTTARSLGVVVRYVYPWPMFGVVAVVALVVAAVSSVIPGHHAARVDPARVLRFD
jgi:putative ABC transport system permease protein